MQNRLLFRIGKAPPTPHAPGDEWKVRVRPPVLGDRRHAVSPQPL